MDPEKTDPGENSADEAGTPAADVLPQVPAEQNEEGTEGADTQDDEERMMPPDSISEQLKQDTEPEEAAEAADVHVMPDPENI